MRILIIEDEKPAAQRLIQLLRKHFTTAEISNHLDTVTGTVKWLEQNPAPDLIFCDIQIADGLSFQIFEKVKVNSPVIFTTAYDQYAIQAFQVNAVDYLLKPIDPEDLAKAVEKYKSRRMEPLLNAALLRNLLQAEKPIFKNRFLVRFGEKIQSIPVEDIAYFFSEERVTFLQTWKGKKYVLDSTLEKLETQINPVLFFRINRKYLTQVSAIEELTTYSNSRLKVKLNKCPEQDIFVSRQKTAALKVWLDGQLD